MKQLLRKLHQLQKCQLFVLFRSSFVYLSRYLIRHVYVPILQQQFMNDRTRLFHLFRSRVSRYNELPQLEYFEYRPECPNRSRSRFCINLAVGISSIREIMVERTFQVLPSSSRRSRRKARRHTTPLCRKLLGCCSLS